MFNRFLNDLYDPLESRYGLVPRLLTDDYFDPSRSQPNFARPRRPANVSLVCRRKTDPSTFKVMLNVKHFRPDEIEVKTVDNFIVIHGKHEEQPDDHGFVSREFTRRYQLPDDVEPASVTSSLSQDGVLTVLGARKILELPKNERMVPITIQRPAAIEEAEKQKDEQQVTPAENSEEKE